MNKLTFEKIDFVKSNFENLLKKNLKLTKVQSPLFLLSSENLNDMLNGVEKPVIFDVDGIKEKVEIIHSLAKWKRIALQKYKFKLNEGLYCDMKAIRRNELLDETHSCLVDQWDWEKIIQKKDRTLKTLKINANKIYKSFLETQKLYNRKFKCKNNDFLPNELFFITSQELEDMYPNDNPKERENKIAKKHKAVFIIGIGDKLKSGSSHDGRSPEYDDWSLNGDIILWNDVLKSSFEISSMGVRVDSFSLIEQLSKHKISKKYTAYQLNIIENKLPFTIGGGIGQSRVTMYIMRSKHIGETQVSIWPKNCINKVL